MHAWWYTCAFMRLVLYNILQRIRRCINTKPWSLFFSHLLGRFCMLLQDLEKYKGFDKLAGNRKTVYEAIVEQLEKLKASFGSKPHNSLADEATYLCDTVKPMMVALRSAVDKAESLLETGLYPYPSYEAMIYSHHFWSTQQKALQYHQWSWRTAVPRFCFSKVRSRMPRWKKELKNWDSSLSQLHIHRMNCLSFKIELSIDHPNKFPLTDAPHQELPPHAAVVRSPRTDHTWWY